MDKKRSWLLQFALQMPVMWAVVSFFGPFHLSGWLMGSIIGIVSMTVGGAVRAFIEDQSRLRRVVEEQQQAIERLQAERDGVTL